MRRFLAIIALPLLACLVISGCGSSKPSASPTASATTNSNAAVTVTGAFGTTPKVNIPKLKATNKLTVKTIIKGTGATFTTNDALAANYAVYLWDGTTSSQRGSTFGSTPQLIPSKTLPGLQTALIGQTVGSRVLAVVPPAEGFGISGNPQAGVTGTTTLVFVIDLVKMYPNTAGAAGSQESDGGGSLPTVSAKAGGAPTLTFPSSPPPSGLVTKTLIKGNGPKIEKGDYVVAQYVGDIWRTKKAFSSSWTAGSPFGFTIGISPAQVIPGWDKALVGQSVGSRVMLVIPSKDGYGSTGESQAGITGTDTLVFVVDIIDALKPTS
jgi:FKBP-type peptidyl-prolyl cis-trans isomerase